MWISTQHDRPTTGHTFCIHQILEKKLEYNEAVHQFFTDFKTSSIDLLIEFGIPMKMVRLIKMCVN